MLGSNPFGPATHLPAEGPAPLSAIRLFGIGGLLLILIGVGLPSSPALEGMVGHGFGLRLAIAGIAMMLMALASLVIAHWHEVENRRAVRLIAALGLVLAGLAAWGVPIVLVWLTGALMQHASCGQNACNVTPVPLAGVTHVIVAVRRGHEWVETPLHDARQVQAIVAAATALRRAPHGNTMLIARSECGQSHLRFYAGERLLTSLSLSSEGASEHNPVGGNHWFSYQQRHQEIARLEALMAPATVLTGCGRANHS